MSTIEKGLGLLGYFSVNRPEIGLSEFRRLTNSDKGTLHRHLTAMRNCGFLEQNPASKAYRLGPALIRLAAIRERTMPMIHIARPHVDALAHATKELVHAALPQADGMSTFLHLDGGIGGTRVGFNTAEILPFHATASGIAMISFGPAKLRATVLGGGVPQFTPQTPQSAAELGDWIAATRRDGYAFSDQTFEAEVCSIAMPFFGGNAEVSGTIAVAMPASRMGPETRHRIAAQLAQTSTAFSKDLGGVVPKPLEQIWARL